MSYIDDLTYRNILDGYGNSYPARKTIIYKNFFVYDDEVQEATVIDSLNNSTIDITLTDIISNGNSANNNKIINLGTPTYSMDAANKLYVDNVSAPVVGTSSSFTIAAGSSYQTLASVPITLVSGNSLTLKVRLFTSKNNKAQTVSYTVYNNSGTLRVADESTTTALASSCTTNYTNGQTVKLTVSGSNILIQVLQELVLSYTGKLNYSLWAL